jgi:hypothetical protein
MQGPGCPPSGQVGERDVLHKEHAMPLTVVLQSVEGERVLVKRVLRQVLPRACCP